MKAALKKLFLVDLVRGLQVTFRNQDPREIYTEQYPMQRPQVAERYRGAPRLNVPSLFRPEFMQQVEKEHPEYFADLPKL